MSEILLGPPGGHGDELDHEEPFVLNLTHIKSQFALFYGRRDDKRRQKYGMERC